MDAIEDMILDSDKSDDDVENEILTKNEMIIFLRNRKRSRNPSTLKQLAIKYISKNIKFWYDYIPQDSGKYLYILSPFDCLSSDDTLAILEELVNTNKFQNAYMHLFLHYKLTKFDFNIIGSNRVGNAILKTMFKRCKRIKELSVNCISNLSYEYIKQIPVQYPKLETLKTDKNIIQDEFLELLGKKCQCLKSLELSSACNIKDMCYESLCLIKTLKSLHIHFCSYLECKTLVKILHSSPKLMFLSLTYSKIRFQFIPPDTKFDNIVYLDISESEVSDNGMQRICSCMPNIRNISINNCRNITCKTFEYLILLNEITHLNAAYLDLDINMEYFFLKKGFHLKHLNLSGMINVRTDTIAMCCPNLEKLFLNDCVDLNINWINHLNLCEVKNQYLRPFTKENYSQCEVCHKMCYLSLVCVKLEQHKLSRIFLGAQNIRELKFLPWNTDPSHVIHESYFMNFINSFFFKKLEILDISNTYGVTKQVVFMILKNIPNLKRLKVVNCDLRENELAEIKEVITSSDIPVYLDVYSGSKCIVRVLPGVLT